MEDNEVVVNLKDIEPLREEINQVLAGHPLVHCMIALLINLVTAAKLQGLSLHDAAKKVKEFWSHVKVKNELGIDGMPRVAVTFSPEDDRLIKLPGEL